MLTQPIISLTRVGKTYIKDKRPITALVSISLTIAPGEFVAITGPSGGGKSTLLQIMGGLGRPTKGQVQIDGVDLATLSDRRLAALRNRRLGFVFQDALLQPFLTVAENIQVPAMFGNGADPARINELAGIVGLQSRASHLPRELSGGQAQRCAIARALFNKPAVLCADEPTGNLDPKNAQTIMELFRQIQTTLGTTIIVVTHDAQLAAKADRVLHLAEGMLDD